MARILKKIKRKKIFSTVSLALFLIIGFFLGISWSSYQATSASSVDGVSARALKQMLTHKNFTLINVHTPYAGEIPGTDTFIAYDQIVASSESLPKDKNTPIIVYCESGRMSTEAVDTLQKLGYTNVKQLTGGMTAWKKAGESLLDLSKLEDQVIPQGGVEMPVVWGDLGPRLVSLGVIDLPKFKQAVNLTPEQEQILTKGSDAKIKIDRTNVQFIVDTLWALGLAQKSLVYDQGPMGTTSKKDAANFASTGGWTLANGSAMDYYNGSDMIPLTLDQQKRVAEISQNVYRPCCGNSTYFPDCNHGMAALAMIELMVSKNLDDNTIYKNLLAFNSYWFADTYLETATYFARQGVSWKDVDAKRVMGAEFSSGQGASDTAKKVGPLPWRTQSGGSCGA